MDLPFQSAQFFTAASGETILARFELIRFKNRVLVSDWIIFFLGLPFFLIGVLWLIYACFWRNDVDGCLVLTSERIAYCQRRRNAFGVGDLLFDVRLEDLIAIESRYSRSPTREVVDIKLLTAYGDGFSIVGQRPASSLMALFVQESLGNDGLRMSSTLYGLVDAMRRRARGA